MASCLSGGGRAYRLDLDIIKSPSTSSWISNSPSPSSTLSESSNSQIAISTRKPRTPRKRPNETYNEAAALLSTVYPKLFSTKHLTKDSRFTKQKYPFPYDDQSELLLQFPAMENSSFLLHPSVLEKPKYSEDKKLVNFTEIKPCLSPGEISSTRNSMEFEDDQIDEDFDAESILDEEIEEGIDSIMGNPSNENVLMIDQSDPICKHSINQKGMCYGYPVGLVDFDNNGFGMRNNYVRAFRKYDEGEWWGFNSVNIRDITPKFQKPPAEKKKKKKKVEKLPELKNSVSGVKLSSSNGKKAVKEIPVEKEKAETAEMTAENWNLKPLSLKLNYDSVLNAWSDRVSPFPDDSPAADGVGNDVQARLASIDLFTENGGIREASVMRYKEKRRTRLFSKKIRYQVRKVNADRRPRMKGRFVRRPDSPESEQD